MQKRLKFKDRIAILECAGRKKGHDWIPAAFRPRYGTYSAIGGRRYDGIDVNERCRDCPATKTRDATAEEATAIRSLHIAMDWSLVVLHDEQGR